MVERKDGDNTPHGKISNVLISNFISETEGRILITAEEGSIIENVILRDVFLKYPMIEDPRLYIEGSGSSQFPKEHLHPQAMGALAAIVADNVTNLMVDNVITQWPSSSVIPEKWQFPERIENGTMRIHTPDYSHQTEFSFLWGRNLKGGYINTPMASASSKKMDKFDLMNSDIRIIE